MKHFARFFPNCVYANDISPGPEPPCRSFERFLKSKSLVVFQFPLIWGLLFFATNLIAEDTKTLAGQDLLKADCIAVLAHPDDETGMAPTLAYYAHAKGKRIVNVYCTRGEGGGNMVGRHWGPSLGVLRESELRACLKGLGVERAYFLDQRDWAYTESARMTLEVWDRDAALEQLVRLFRLTRPDVVLTMNPAPTSGQHGHHQSAGILAIEAFELAADPTAFPDQIIQEGIEPWQPKKLYIGASPDPYGATIESTRLLPDGRVAAAVAGAALSHHRSQGFGRMAESPWMARPRSYRLILSCVGYEESETDLFRGLDSTPSIPALMPIKKLSRGEVQSSWRFKSRPALERFRIWAEQRGIFSLTEGLQQNVPIAMGHHADIELVPTRPEEEIRRPRDIQLHIPDGWRIEFLPVQSDANRLLYRIHAPSTASEPVTVRAEWGGAGGRDSTELTLMPVPSTELFLSPNEPAPDMADDVDWNKATVLAIDSSKTWQGQADDEADSSATAWLRAYADRLWVRVAVNDDVVVSNIAPNDIRGHWRSDSVEICIDPAMGSEHTLNTFKAGVFPFDSAGQVRAARDADANQGPIETTAPGMILESRKTRAGYVIATSIPWTTLGVVPDSGNAMAFNILIYDGDKADAKPGENINECRLAWSPARGVQGRPEDWGRIYFK